MDFDGVRLALTEQGWARVAAPATSLDALAQELGRVDEWEEIQARSPEDARRGTFSAAVGLGAFPWHTDGAQARTPPRYLLLAASGPSSTPTELLDCQGRPELDQLLRHVVLRVSTDHAQVRYERAMVRVGSNRRYRWDPMHCPPTRQGVERDVESCLAEADHAVDWRSTRAVVIDNWRMLHRRPPLARDDHGRRTLKRIRIFEREK